MAYCGNCGQIVPEGAIYCGGCGQRIANDSHVKMRTEQTDCMLDESSIPYSVDDNGGIVCIDGEMGQALYVYMDHCDIVTFEEFEAYEYDAEQAYNFEKGNKTINIRGLFSSPPRNAKQFYVKRGKRSIYYSTCRGIQAENIGEGTVGYLIFYNEHYEEVLFFFDGSHGIIRSEMLKLYNTVLIPAIRKQSQRGSVEKRSILSESQFYIAQNGNPIGPFNIDAIRSMIMNGMVNADTLFWTEGMTTWRKGGEIDAIEHFL